MATIEMPEPTAVANLSAQTAYAAWTIRNALVDAQKFLLPKADVDVDHLAPVRNILFDPEKGSDKEGGERFKVGIIGAGSGGLFAAMIFDHLAEHYGVKVDYEILEVNQEDRLGGRLFSHYFSDPTGQYPIGPHDYYDVGAMRFPQIKVMDRTFALFKELGMNLNDKPNPPKGDLRPYLLNGTNVPMLYNDIQIVQKGEKITAKTFEIPDVSDEAENFEPGEIIAKRIKEFTDKYNESKNAATEKEQVEKLEAFWKFLMKDGDKYSVRQWLSTKSGKDFKPLDYNTIEYLETLDYGNRWYDQALSEMVLESINFDNKAPWWCVEGGAQQLARRMRDKLVKKDCIQYGKRVMALDRVLDAENKYTTHIDVTVKGEPTKRRYDAVINSAPLGAMQQMRLEGLSLNWGTKQAIRSLGYGASCKVGVRFKTMWWKDPKVNLNIRGGVAKTDLPIRCCVYPSYNVDDKAELPGVLLVSYTWSQEADRIGALISRNSPADEEELKEVIIHDLARLHAEDKDKKPDPARYEELRKIISDNWLTHYAYDWSSSSSSVSAFAYFGPSQFANMYPGVTASDGKHIIVGEAASAHHAWVVGALESAVRGVFQFLSRHSWKDAAVRNAARAYCEDKIQLPFGPIPAEYDRTKDCEKIPAGPNKPTSAASPIGEFTRLMTVLETARLAPEYPPDRFEQLVWDDLPVELVKPIFEAAAAA